MKNMLTRLREHKVLFWFRMPSIEHLYTRFELLDSKCPTKIRWMALLAAPANLSLITFLAGTVSILGSALITIGLESLASDTSYSKSLIALLLLAFLLESAGFLIKERQEMLLVVAIRQITYRRFRKLFRVQVRKSKIDEIVLTYPAQISQFAYVVDFAISTVQVVLFIVISFYLYGINGVLAVFLIAALVSVSIKLVAKIGSLWERYIELEGERRVWIKRLAKSLPRGKRIPSWEAAKSHLSRVRNTEESLLRARVRLQVLNSFLDRGALTAVLTLIAIVGTLFWPTSNIGISIILAARYLHSAVQNNVVNYRVIRLAVPMMRDLYEIERDTSTIPSQTAPIAPDTRSVEVLDGNSARADLLRTTPGQDGVAFVPREPAISQSILSAWHAGTDPYQKSEFRRLATSMGLQPEVLARSEKEIETLSSGELQRLTLAMVLSESPDWLILDNSFASLDPVTREVVAEVVLENVHSCSLLASSLEYVPSSFARPDTATENITEPPSSSSEVVNTENSSEELHDPSTYLPDPDKKKATFLRAIQLVFGMRFLLVGLGAFLLSASEIAFAISISQNDLTALEMIGLSTTSLVGVVVGSLMLSITVYRVPIRRLSVLHDQLIGRLERFANSKTAGAVVGRVGEDFSSLQMEIPGALGSVTLVTVHSVLLIGSTLIGAPAFLIVFVAALPLAIFVWRRGLKTVIPATTDVANARGEFIGAINVQAGSASAPNSPQLRVAGEKAYLVSEDNYIRNSIRLTNAYALQSGLTQLLVVTLNSLAVLLISIPWNYSAEITYASILFFILTLSAGLQTTIETLQHAGVVSLTAERVRMLEEFELARTPHIAPQDSLRKILNSIDSGNVLTALIGSTGAGKSVLLDAIYDASRSGDVTIIPSTDPLASEECSSSGIQLLRSQLIDGSARILLLDETFRNLSPSEEREELTSLRQALGSSKKQAVIVLHSRTNLDCFEKVISLD
ncbi:MAG: hypothetical protein Q4D87_06650 [Actinomycetaceae bacterium]|nr:hypothetical protein [Actinomycetaceae bacterium]